MIKLILAILFLSASSSNAEEYLMMNEPKILGGVSCGNSASKFALSEYMGRDVQQNCSKIYIKDKTLYYFNSNEQLYSFMSDCKSSLVQDYIDKFGEPQKSEKTENAIFEGQTNIWKGKNIGIILQTTTNRSGFSSDDTCKAWYFCPNIATKTPNCNQSEINQQKSNTDKFVTTIGLDTITSDNELELLIIAKKFSQKTGLPRPVSAHILQTGDGINKKCIFYNTKDFNRIKQVLFKKIGDIAYTPIGLAFVGNLYEVDLEESAYTYSQQSPKFKPAICISKTK